VRSCAWTSSPMTGSYRIVDPRREPGTARAGVLRD
jgi:hypothetical protein